MINLDQELIQIYKETASVLTGNQRRSFQAKITCKYLRGSANKAEKILGWNRNTVKLGIQEQKTGYICYVEIHPRGCKKTEEKKKTLEQDINDIVEPSIHVDPKFKSPLRYTKITAKAVRKALIASKGYRSEDLPTERTISNILNRLGYTLKRVQKTKPQKKSRKPTQYLPT
jgi:hypothetical protein